MDAIDVIKRRHEIEARHLYKRLDSYRNYKCHILSEMAKASTILTEDLQQIDKHELKAYEDLKGKLSDPK